MPNGISHYYHLDDSISNLRDVGWYFSFLFKFYIKLLFANSGEADQTLRFAAYDLVLHCLPIFHKRDARLICVKRIPRYLNYQRNEHFEGSKFSRVFFHAMHLNGNKRHAVYFSFIDLS